MVSWTFRNDGSPISINRKLTYKLEITSMKEEALLPMSERVGHTLVLGTTRVGKTCLAEMLKVMRSIRKNCGMAKATIATGLLFGVTSAQAALPDTAAPSVAAADGDYIGLLQGYAFDIAIVIGLVLGTLAFLAVAKNMIAIYNEIGTGKKTWGDMGMHGGMGVLLLVFVVFLLTEAAAIIF